MKFLTMPRPLDIDFDQYKVWSEEVLSMCYNPTKKGGFEVELVRHVGGLKPGLRGIARPFNGLDIARNQEIYKKELDYKIMGLPDLTHSFDFFPYSWKDGVKYISMFHSHISQFDFKFTNYQFKLEL